MEDWRDRLKRIIDERGLNMKQLSLSAGLGETAVRDMLQKVTSPRIDTITAIADELGLTLTELMEGRKLVRREVPIIGAIEHLEMWVPANVSQMQHVAIDVDLSGGAPVALRVNTTAMAPAYRAGDVLVGAKLPDAAQRLGEIIGIDCILETADGQRLVKFVARGTSKNRVTLKGYHPTTPDLENVALAWAAPISVIIRGKPKRN